MKAIAILCVVIALTGCQVIAPKVGPQVAKAVNKYCAEPYVERQVIRSSVNDQIAPNKIAVTCSGDPQ